MIIKLKYDLPASIVVFLVALPLCMGISLASGAPILSGLISGILGGIVVGFISESRVSVSGPAAGLVAVVLSAILELKSFEVFLLAVLISGVFQFFLGYFKAGIIADFIPSNIIKGLLASIGLVLILKQIPHAVGYDSDYESDFSFKQPDGENTFSELFVLINNFKTGAIIITLISFFILYLWHKTNLKKLKFLPGSLAVVIIGVLINWIFEMYFPNLYIESSHLVNIPKINNFSDLIIIPNFSAISNYKVWFFALTLAIVATIETLLNLEAIENLDPHKRVASPNRELIAQGVGNFFSGLVGGLPITSVIVRSTVNLNSNVFSKWSAIFHGFFLLFSVLFLSSYLNLIPLASLAVILIVTGFKLVNFAIFKGMYKKGLNQFIPFVVTITAILFTDLLIGIIIGSFVSVFYILKSNFKNSFKFEKFNLHTNETIRIELANQTTFLHKATIKKTLWKIPENSKVIIDAQYCDFIDNDILELISDFKNTVSVEKNIKLNILGISEKYNLDDHVEFITYIDKETQQRITPDDALNILKDGNKRFVDDKTRKKYYKHQISATSTEQNPFAVVLGCIDSRATIDLIFDVGIGDLLTIKIAGNIINEDILGSMEFGVGKLGAKLIVVLGHTYCGAVIGACNNVKAGHITTLLEKINPAIEMDKSTINNRNGNNVEFVNNVTLNNIHLNIERIRKESKSINELEKEGKIKIIGGLYDITTGVVTFLE